MYGVIALVFSSCAPKIWIEADEVAPENGQTVIPPSMVPEFTSAPIAQEKENRCHDVVTVRGALPRSVVVMSPRSNWICCVPLVALAQIENVHGVAFGLALMICCKSAA